ncbi:MAG TPA: xanthine dehydrogenase family protein molybdopterin-binding subunit [Chloroflexaceae bacterium]|nr:xanthine dehydrogenase family protein molybdopterin-binding subunit [Chloroflexaceae bacterium]
MSARPADFQHLGKPRRLSDGLEKVTGKARYSGDLALPGMLYARPVLSPYAHAAILSIAAQDALALPGVVAVLTADDLPTRGRVATSRQTTTLASGEVRYRGEPVALVLAESEAAAADGAAAVLVDYDPLPVVADADTALAPGAPVIWPQGAPSDDAADLTAAHAAVGGAEDEQDRDAGPPSNLHERRRYERGDVEAALAAADVVVERAYTTPIVHQAYLEPHAAVADYDPLRGTLEIYTSTQGQFGVRDEVARLLGLSRAKVTVHPMTVGGGFGAKYGIIEPLAAAASVAARRPVRLTLTRTEDFLTTTPTPASEFVVRLGARRDGTITALDAVVTLDNGVYPFTLGGIVAFLLGGYYRFPNLRMELREVLTNKPQCGAYRAPGAPQATFAIESSVDELAHALGMDPLELRLMNAAGPEDLTGEGEPWGDIGLRDCLAAALRHPLWQNRQRECGPGEGVGLAVGGWPCGNTTAGAICRADTDGTIRVHVGSVDISGTNTGFALIAAEILGVSPDQVEIVAGDTRSGPFAGPSGGSQITYAVGNAVAEAARAVRRQLLELASQHFEASAEDLELRDGQVFVRGVPSQSITIAALAERAEGKKGGPGPVVGEGRAAPPTNAPGFVVHLAKVHVDAETGRVTPLRYVAIQDVGFAINPLLLAGQIHGGSAQGIGFGLYEALRYDANGELLTASLMDYTLPRATELPPIEAVFVEHPSPHGPFGARGVGEPPITAGPAALANAVRAAAGVRVAETPLREEVVWRALRAAG